MVSNTLGKGGCEFVGLSGAFVSIQAPEIIEKSSSCTQSTGAGSSSREFINITESPSHLRPQEQNQLNQNLNFHSSLRGSLHPSHG